MIHDKFTWYGFIRAVTKVTISTHIMQSSVFYSNFN